MTREEAIEYAEKKNLKLEEEIERPGSYYGAYAMYSTELEFVSMAISALRQQERERKASTGEGLRCKYIVRKADTGEGVDGCFVLRPDRDRAAVAALRAYAAATDNDALATDILNWVGHESNEPLTMDELRQMNGEPLWVVWPDGRIKPQWFIVGSAFWIDMFVEWDGKIFLDYGKIWLAYRQKPEEGTV